MQAKAAYAGIPEDADTMIERSMHVLADWAEANGKPVVYITPDMTPEDAAKAVEAVIASLPENQPPHSEPQPEPFVSRSDPSQSEP
jgi:hypothetical protein